ncbi:NAD(P)/FAD-dependent oxidoreductase [Mycobacterium ahvazicum]|uniref:NAD(P)/FAD-dependent oxidoreductase n=1 Tax=Mycobacterium ahvazicum TaxID=1964395 RepID=A0A2K4YB19_9MYCO|nr:NAD(P)/FAD-dependent oxidoreductase [Mycobacterium ahvazicum]
MSGRKYVSDDREARRAAADRPIPCVPMSDAVDVIVVGAGFAGLYALHKPRAQGPSVWVQR